MVYFYQILHTDACQQYLATGMCNSLFTDEDLLSIIFGCGQLVKMLITLELHGIFDYLYIFFKLAGKMTKNRKNIKKKIGCLIT